MDVVCDLCGEPEDVDHILINLLGRHATLDNFFSPVSVPSLISSLLDMQCPLFNSIIAYAGWILWCSRNQRLFERKNIKPEAVVDRSMKMTTNFNEALLPIVGTGALATP